MISISVFFIGIEPGKSSMEQDLSSKPRP